MTTRELPEQNGFVIAVRSGNKGHTVAWFALEDDAKVFGEALLRDNPNIEAVSLVPVAIVIRFPAEGDGMVNAVTLRQSGLARFDADEAGEQLS